MKVNHLPWDSNLVKSNVAVIEIEHSNYDELELGEALARLKKANYSLIYLFDSLPLRPLPMNILNDFHGIEMPAKLTFTCNNFHYRIGEVNTISTYDSDIVNEELLQLALAAGGYSRFKQDSNFLKGTYEKLYTAWIERSVLGELSDIIFTYEIGNKIVGFITVKENDVDASIGLIAVDANCRGKGIGSNLLQSTFNYAEKKHLASINVNTQDQNTSAIALYKKNGFYLTHTQSIYHFWLKEL